MSLCFVVEDHGDTRAGYEEFLAFSGFEVMTAGSGEELWALLESRTPDAIVMDLQLPTVDGWTLIKELRGREPTARTPVLVVSASVREADRQAAWEAGCTAFLPKPCDPTHVISELQRLIEEARCAGGGGPGDM